MNYIPLIIAILLALPGAYAFSSLRQKQLSASASLVSPVTSRNGIAEQSPRGRFRVVLIGYKVNHETVDDFTEGDGTGDEILITSDSWVLNTSGQYRRLPQVRTKVMGDPTGFPERVKAGTRKRGFRIGGGTIGSPPMAGLQTGDTFPTAEPWRGTSGQFFGDKPPMVLWTGELARGDSMVVIVPIIWEWDSNEVSSSQRSIEQGLDRWLRNSHLSIATWSNFEMSYFWRNFEGGKEYNPAVFNREAAMTRRTPVPGGWRTESVSLCSGDNWVNPNGKGGTRPVGYKHCPGNGGDKYHPSGLRLTYDIAAWATTASNTFLYDGTRKIPIPGAFNLRYIDVPNDGDYVIYLKVEQVSL